MSNSHDNDKVLDEYLSGDSEISRRYRAESKEQTPEHLKNATKAAVEALIDADIEKATYKSRKEWYVPLSLAAVLVISISVVFNVYKSTEKELVIPSQSLESYTEEVLARPGGQIEPLPEIKPYEAYKYKSAAEDKRDPFQMVDQKIEPDVADESFDDGLTEEMEREIHNRNREELERFELDSLRMVGTLDDTGEKWGLIQDPDGAVHRVKVGNYMGRNLGKILNVFEDRIELREIVRNNRGRWEERQVRITLTDDYRAAEIDNRQK